MVPTTLPARVAKEPETVAPLSTSCGSAAAVAKQARPKSRSFAVRGPVTMMFSGLMSRCRMPAAWA